LKIGEQRNHIGTEWIPGVPKSGNENLLKAISFTFMSLSDYTLKLFAWGIFTTV
jgi:hypothetical protein